MTAASQQRLFTTLLHHQPIDDETIDKNSMIVRSNDSTFLNLQLKVWHRVYTKGTAKFFESPELNQEKSWNS